jgi:hypothetical protein
MRLGQRQQEAADRFRDRREREDCAPRLRSQIAKLATLSIEIDDRPGTTGLGATRYVRHVVVQRAPALFVIPCSDERCEAGGHDVTRQIMQSLLAGDQEFVGEDVCFGWRGDHRCDRVLHFVGHATYSGERPQAKGNGRG